MKTDSMNIITDNDAAVTFKTQLTGYQKKEVDEYVINLKNTMQTSASSYEEKIDQLKNNVKMITKELETSKNSYAALKDKYNVLSDKLKLVEDQSANIERLMSENEQLKERIQKNEDYISIAAELKAKNEVLGVSIEKAQEREKVLISKQRELEDQLYRSEQTIKENNYKYKTETAELSAKMGLAEENRKTELSKIINMLADLNEVIKSFEK